MLKARYANYFAIALILSGCENDHNPDQFQVEADGLKLQLRMANSQNNLITGVDIAHQLYTIHFEEGNALNIHAKYVKSIEYDSTAWLARFHLSDGTEQYGNFVGKLDLRESFIKLNPYFSSPLSALAEIKTVVKGKFKVSVRGKPADGITIEKTVDYYGDMHVFPVLGLYEGYANQVEFVFLSKDNSVRCSQVITIQTSVIPDKPALEIEILKNTLTNTYSGLYIVSDLKLGFDQRGEIRWYYQHDGASFFNKLLNGNFIVSEAPKKAFVEVTMMGQQVKKYDVPYQLHHEIVEMANGNFLVASHSPPGPPYEDVVVEVERSSGAIVKSWDFNTILDPMRKPLPDTQPGDWLHINALYYDETDNTIVISGRSQCAVVKIDYSTGNLKWILGNHKEWKASFAPFLLKPIDRQGNELDTPGFDFWNYGQHALQRLANGNLLLYDNGDYRGFYDNPNVPQASYTRVVEYKINEAKKTVELVWQFDNKKSVFTKYTGYTQHLGETRLAAYMWVTENTPKILEIDKNNQVLYEATINRGKLSYYRTIKVDLYKGM